jgi:hypothetical protein
MEYACQMMQMRNSTTAKPAIVEDKVATAESSMTNRIMFTEVMVAGEERMNTQPQQPSQNSNGQKAEGQDMAGNNMEFHKSRDVITRLASNDNTGVGYSEGRPQKGSYARAQKKGEQCTSAQV